MGPPGRLRTTRRRRSSARRGSRRRLRGRLPRWPPRRRPKRRPRRTWTWLTRNRGVRLLRRPLRFKKFTFTGPRLELKAPENPGTDFNARNLPIDQSGIPTPGTWNRFLQNTWNGSPLSDPRPGSRNRLQAQHQMESMANKTFFLLQHLSKCFLKKISLLDHAAKKTTYKTLQ